MAPFGSERVEKNTSRYTVTAEARYLKLHFPSCCSVLVPSLVDQSRPTVHHDRRAKLPMRKVADRNSCCFSASQDNMVR